MIYYIFIIALFILSVGSMFSIIGIHSQLKMRNEIEKQKTYYYPTKGEYPSMTEIELNIIGYLYNNAPDWSDSGSIVTYLLEWYNKEDIAVAVESLLDKGIIVKRFDNYALRLR